ISHSCLIFIIGPWLGKSATKAYARRLKVLHSPGNLSAIAFEISSVGFPDRRFKNENNTIIFSRVQLISAIYENKRQKGL
ncbi:MAG: hypothetical protein ACKOFE_00460, partial [Bacteroidota bacterium]